MFSKNRTALLRFAIGALLVITVGATAQNPPLSLESQRRAEGLLKQMTLEEKVGQLNQAAGIVMPMLGSESPTASSQRAASGQFSG